MGSTTKSGADLAGSTKREAFAIVTEHLDEIADLLKSEAGGFTALELAQKLLAAQSAHQAEPTTVAERVKKYDHRCDYQEGERVYVDNRYGKSLATIIRIIRQPPTAFCDKAFLEFEDKAYRSKWESERSTPYFAINSSRADADPTWIEVGGMPNVKKPTSRGAATAVIRTAKLLEKKLADDPRFHRSGAQWQFQDETGPSRPHISAERGGAAPDAALPQGAYKAPLLEAIDRLGEATIGDIKRSVQASLKLGPADWEADPTGKIVWIHRLHAAIKHLKRVGAIDSPRREVYRRIQVARKESA